MTRPLIVTMALAASLPLYPLVAQVTARGARVEVSSPASPIPVLANGRRVLAYELRVTNFGMGPLVFRQIEIFAGTQGRRIADYRDDTLTQLIQPVGVNMRGMAMGDSAMGSSGRRLDPGQMSIVFLWLSFPPESLVPGTLRHRLVFDIVDTADQRRDGGTQAAVDSAMVPVLRSAIAPLIRAPLDSGEWLVGDGPSNASSHRRSLNAVGGKTWSSERFAIDWNMIGPNGNIYHGDEHRNQSYWAFGQPVVAVAAGEVVMAVDSIADHDPHGPIPPVTLANLAGNFVILRIAPHRFVSYAHLQRGSVRVRPGQRVVRGAVIGLLGNTGQSTAPHLHFQVTDGPSFLGAQGVPFRLEAFEFLATANDFEEGKFPGIRHRGDMPVEDQVIRLH
jgi:murein DD-endopeptidase MepM/ murein hydrolase activator NlpD